ncbi:hypothetical protein [Candidatus Clostridium radicumherbarum]|uniref:Uncharacterized protein n=1 Tax=Candidatus Clostridium radicumherbarum TaxID=3381662 RepID=A0ABW8TTW2_9CLOT
MRNNIIKVNFTAAQKRRAKVKKFFILLLSKIKNLFSSKNRHNNKPQYNNNYNKSTM